MADSAVLRVTANSSSRDYPNHRKRTVMTTLKSAKPGTPVLLGIPFDANSSWLRGAAGAPPIIRVAFGSASSNFSTETGIDLSAEGAYCDAGDLKFTFEDPFVAIEAKVGELLDHNLRPVCLGGDHRSRCPSFALLASTFPISPSSTLTRTPIFMTNWKATGCRMLAPSPASWKRVRRNG